MLKNLYSGIRSFQDNLADGKPNEWRCRAGARYLYICEDGLVHYCSQQRGYPGVPLESLHRSTTSAASSRRRSRARRYCTVGCVHRVSTMDFWRRPQTSAAPRSKSGGDAVGVLALRLLTAEADFMPPLTRRGADGAQAACRRAYSLFSRFCTPKNTSKLRLMARDAVMSTDR